MNRIALLGSLGLLVLSGFTASPAQADHGNKGKTKHASRGNAWGWHRKHDAEASRWSDRRTDDGGWRERVWRDRSSQDRDCRDREDSARASRWDSRSRDRREWSRNRDRDDDRTERARREWRRRHRD